MKKEHFEYLTGKFNLLDHSWNEEMLNIHVECLWIHKFGSRYYIVNAGPGMTYGAVVFGPIENGIVQDLLQHTKDTEVLFI